MKLEHALAIHTYLRDAKRSAEEEEVFKAAWEEICRVAQNEVRVEIQRKRDGWR